MNTEAKLKELKNNIKKMESIVVAFSGGVDSSFLLKVAYDLLGDKLLGITAKSSTYPEREYREAIDFTIKYQIPHMAIASEELQVEGFADNPPNRCYLCKKELFHKLKNIAEDKGYKFVAEGSNFDDLGDFRPGFQAISELGIASPLMEVGLTKNEIRLLSKEMGLSTWDKQSFACLSSRFPYGEKITEQKLQMVDKAEQYLLDIGFKQVRVRHHGTIARIEVDNTGFTRFFDKEIRESVYKEFKEIGFTYIALDLQGYRTGSMNEGLDLKKTKEG